MGQRIEINPVTRIEGHAKVTIDLGDDGHVDAACLHVMEFRGFERFVRGMRVETMPIVTTRICGTCPHAHHLASAKALDAVYGVTPPPAALLLRELLNAGSMIHSHAIHFFALAGPDLFVGVDAPPERRNLVALLDAAPELAQAALKLRSLGQKIAEQVGGRGTHPITCVPGGIASGLDSAAREQLQAMAAQALQLAELAVDQGRQALERNESLARSLVLKSYDLGTVNDGRLDCYDGTLVARTPEGAEALRFESAGYADVMVEQALPYSYAKQVSLKLPDGALVPYRVGPLARLNCCDSIGTERATREWERYKSMWGTPCHLTVAQHHARLIELLHHAEKAVQILQDDRILSQDLVDRNLGTPRRAVAHVEAPRGVLLHDYDVDSNGIVQGANLLVATQHNVSGINATVRDAAEQFVTAPDEQLLNRVEFAIRCWDPCLSCSTHAVGQMPMEVTMRRRGQAIRKVVR